MSRFKIGDKVILGIHEYLSVAGSNWDPAMSKFVGKVATIINGCDNYFYPIEGTQWRVDLDGGVYAWRELNMCSAVEYPNQKCKDCGVPCPHAEPNQPDKTYICKFCEIINEI